MSSLERLGEAGWLPDVRSEESLLYQARGDRGALEAFVLWLTNIRVCAGELGAFDAHLCVGSACAGEA